MVNLDGPYRNAAWCKIRGQIVGSIASGEIKQQRTLAEPAGREPREIARAAFRRTHIGETGGTGGFRGAAADAWPLMGVANFEEFNGRIVLGKPTIEPRLTGVPVRMPLPPAPFQGSIYENQRAAAKRFFANAAE